MKITIIGTGNVGSHLATAFTAAGHTVTCHHHLPESPSLTADDIVVLAIRDEGIAETGAAIGPDALILHTSGTTAMGALQTKRHGVIYPLQTLTKGKDVDYAGMPVCIEAGNPADLARVRTLAESISQNVHEVSSAQRRVLHIAAVFACNFTNHLYAIAHDILDKEGLDFDLLKPLIRETAEKVMNNDPKDVQTGPAVRGDEETMRKHLGHLQVHEAYGDLYRLLSGSIKAR